MLDDNPHWYKDAIIYELHVRAFHDNAGDGVGDFRGLTQKLDYLQDLGVTVLWLLPFYPSPLKDDGYDIADYTNINPDYGTLRDFQEVLDEAHKRGLRVITELVINHTSDQHPWFQRARRSPPGSTERDFYVWSKDPKKYKDARIIFKDFEHSNWSYDQLAGAYYWHRFYHHQPDLNYDNPAVWKAIFPVLDFWMGMGVDGMRLDAVPYLYERQGTNCENLPETHVFLKALRSHVDAHYKNRLLLAEANQWPEDAIAYFGDGDECHMNFHFPLMPRMFMAIHMEDRFPILDILAQTPAIPDNCQWGLFLRNHDELTLEMVTDEERDYMYRAYAGDLRARINLGIRRRLAPLMGNSRRRIELMNGLLFSLPGTPILYYGDEIGMGDNIYLGDRNGVRTPMQWSADRNAGFSRCNPQKLFLPIITDPEYHYESLNVEAQQNNPASLLWWTKRLIALRKRHKAFGRGSIEFLKPDNRKIFAFLRRHEDENILVVANLSRFAQYAELDLSAFEGSVPLELFGRTVFPRIGQLPYLLTLGPHSFYWFALQPVGWTQRRPIPAPAADSVPELRVEGDWRKVLDGVARTRLEEVLPAYLMRRGWPAARTPDLRSVTLRDLFPFTYANESAYLALVSADYHEGSSDTFVLPLAYASGGRAERIAIDNRDAVVAWIAGPTERGVLFDAVGDPAFCLAALRGIGRGQTTEGAGGASARAVALSGFAELRGSGDVPLNPTSVKCEPANSLVVFGDRLVLKIFRRVEEGPNPEFEIGRYLTEKVHFAHCAPLAGYIEFRRKRKAEPVTLGVVYGYVANEGDGWGQALDELSSFYERVLAASSERPRVPPKLIDSVVGRSMMDPPQAALEHIGGYLESVRLLGHRLAGLHRALAAETEDPAFVPEPFTPHYQRSLYQALRNDVGQVLDLLRRRLPDLSPRAREPAERLLQRQKELLDRGKGLLALQSTTVRTRIHGDLHLGQLLDTGKDYVFIDFEGETEKPLSDRRVKRSPLRDVAALVRSFHHAAASVQFDHSKRSRLPGVVRPEDEVALEEWGWFWYSWVSAVFVHAYREAASGAPFLPATHEEFRLLLDLFLIERALDELERDLLVGSEHAAVPLAGLHEVLDAP